jgi:hypothetical protein
LLIRDQFVFLLRSGYPTSNRHLTHRSCGCSGSHPGFMTGFIFSARAFSAFRRATTVGPSGQSSPLRYQRGVLCGDSVAGPSSR